ncbi:MAG: hypothetical protein EOQ55_03305 [Mesorhizobium sp.]|nr:MAG: hypothetical protein EOQ55_03305 [Mesorhizobium sp.]
MRGVPLIDLRIVCGEDADFVNAIEPSEQGGKKIAAGIVSFLAKHEFRSGRAELIVRYESLQLPFIGDRAFLSVAEDETAAERAFVALPSADLFSPIISQETAILVRPDTLVAIGRIAGGIVVENHSLIWALEVLPVRYCSSVGLRGWRVCQGEQRQRQTLRYGT